MIPPSLRSYFFETSAPDPDQLVPHLWPAQVDPADEATAFEQYKLYVEIADRGSARRLLANAFFLALNTTVFTALAIFWKDLSQAPVLLGLFPTAVLVTQCFVWFWIIRFYQQLNAGKWAVVGAFEKRLPTSPWWAAEWVALGEGKDPSRYWPIRHVEEWVPLLFGLVYLGWFLALALLA